jgi:GTP-binding protein HflX
VALVGYTNAGKSTLLNRLTDATVLVEDRLFSTLDPATRRLRLPGGETVLLSDTVGFVRRLPHQLVESFQSTLEEVAHADFVAHLVDATDPDVGGRIAAVHAVLGEIDAGGVPEQLVFTKSDTADSEVLDDLRRAYPDAITVSARSGEGVPALLARLGDRLRALTQIVELRIPYERGDVLPALHREGVVLVTVHDDTGMRVRARLPDAVVGRFSDLVTAVDGLDPTPR